MCAACKESSGFTLIELAIVLVIIGLLVGGVLAGRDLIEGAKVSATISQIQKYNTAVNTFREKYGGLPGDLDASAAEQFGFIPRGQYAGEGDGNGVIEGVASNSSGQNNGALENIGETTTFWVDLSQAHLIEGTFNDTSETGGIPNYYNLADPGQVFPEAKLGQGNYIYVWSGGWSSGDGTNYFGISSNFCLDCVNSEGDVYWSSGLTVRQAYDMDTKVDDGMPQSGNVMAMKIYNGTVLWAAQGENWPQGAHNSSTNAPTTVATPYVSTNCYDNNNTAGPQTYSIAQNASAVNCALSFRFQ